MRKRCHRRRLNADPSAFIRAIGLQHDLDDSQQVDLVLGIRAAAMAMRSGAGVEHHVHTLASAVNLSLVLCERGAGIEFTDAIIAAQMALMRAFERGKRAGSWGFDGPALAQVERAIEVYEAQLGAVRGIEIRDAVREVQRRMDKGLVFTVEKVGAADGARAGD